jgi:hypothetical protein
MLIIKKLTSGRVDCDFFLFVEEGFPPCRIMMAQTVKVKEVGTVFGPKYCGIAPYQQGTCHAAKIDLYLTLNGKPGTKNPLYGRKFVYIPALTLVYQEHQFLNTLDTTFSINLGENFCLCFDLSRN